MKAKVTKEVYRCQKSEFDSPTDAIAYAYRIMVEEAGKPGWLRAITIYRTTKHEPVIIGTPGSMFAKTINETITGQITVEAPGQLAERPAMSRYSPVNGWVVPEEIEVEN